MGRLRRSILVATVTGAGVFAGALPAPEPAAGFNPFKLGCTVAGVVNPTAKKVCTAVKIGVGAFSVIKGALGGGPGAGSSSAGSTASTALGLAAVGTWVLGGAAFTIHETAKVLGHTTEPQLTSTWFSATYWRLAGIGALLTLPFLFAAAVQALINSDLTLLARAALGYLPLAMGAVAIASPLTMLLVAASDELSRVVSSASGDAASHLLHKAGITIAALTALSRSPFVVFFVGLLVVAAAFALWIELLLREAAVYVIVLMLPLAFAAMVWPARRVWAARAVELLVALILSKFAVVAVLSLGGAAMNQMDHSVTALLAGVVLLGMGVFAPWALLRLIPLAELASGAVSSLRHAGQAPVQKYREKRGEALARVEDWGSLTAAMRREGELALAAGTEPPDLAEPPATERGGRPRGHGEGHRDGEQPQPAAGEDAGREPAMAAVPGPQPADLGASPAIEPARSSPETSAPQQAPPSSQRIPGLPDRWQQPNGSWSPVILGPQGVLAHPWPTLGSVAEGSGQRTEPAQDPLGESPGDDHDPAPPPQPPPGGPL